MHVSPNPALVRFADSTPPAEWTSRQAERLYAAAMEAEADGSTEWSRHCHGSVTVAEEPADAVMSPYGTDPEHAARRARQHIANLRAEVDRLEGILAVYGGEAFVVRPAPVTGVRHPFQAEPMLLGVLRRRWTHIWIQGRAFVRDASRSAVRAPALDRG